MEYDIITNRIFVAVFLLVTLVVGLWAGRNVKTFSDYALANKSLGIGTLMITLIATWMGSYNILAIYRAYKTGMLEMFYPLCLICVSLVLGWYVFPKLIFFRECYTLGDVMRKVYGPSAALISSALIALFSISLITSQLIVMTYLCDFLGIKNKAVIVIILGLFTTAYTFTGGIRSVATTDVLQFILVVIGISLMINLGLYLEKIGGIRNLLGSVKEDYPNHIYFWQHEELGYNISADIFQVISPIYFFVPPIIQRVLMTNDKKKISSMFSIFTVFYFIFCTIILLLGFIVLVSKNGVDNTLDMKSVLPYTLNLMLGTPFLQSLFVLSFLALAMSTADSFLNALVVSIYKDFALPCVKGHDKHTEATKFTRYIALVTGLLCTLLAYIFMYYKPSVLIAYFKRLASAICLPFIMGVLGLKGSKKVFLTYISVFTGIFLMMIPLGYYANISIYHYFIKLPDRVSLTYRLTTNAWLFATIFSTIVFFVAHYVENGCFVWIKQEKGTQFTSKLLDDDLPWYHFFVRPLRWAQNKVAIYQGQPVLLALFMAVFYMLPNFTMKTSEKEVYFKLLGGLRIVGIGLCTALAMKNQWPKRWERCYHLLYFVTILYCLPFVNTLLFLYDPQDALAIVLFLLHILLMITLVDWRTFVMFAISGTGLAWGIYMLLEGRAFPAMNFDTGWTLVVGLFFTLLIGFLFARKKQQSYEEWLGQHRYLAKQHKQTAARFQKAYQFQYDVAHGINKDGVDVVSKLQEVEKLIADHGTEEHPEIKKAHEQLGMVKAHLRDVLYKHREHLKLSVDKCSIKDFMKTLEEAAHKAGLNTQQLFFVKKTKQTEVVCDVAKMAQAFVHMLQELQAKNLTQAPIYVHCCDALLGYPLTKFDDQVKKVKALQIVITTDTAINDKVNRYQGDIEIGSHIPATELNIPSVERDRIIGAHYGVFDSGLPVGINKQLFVIPCNVRDIRSKAMDVDEAPNAHYVNHPKAVEVEQKFYDKAAAKAPHIPLEQLEKAVDLIRRYHAHQRRKSGEPFYLHPIEVATILLDVTQEQDVIIAALCHDIVEDAAMDFSQLTLLFGQNMVDLVSGVSKLDKGTRKKKMSSSENIQQLINQKDQRVLYIKIADRVHNMRTIGAHDPAKRKKIAEETLQCFVVLAKRLRLVEMAQELEELALAVLNK